jgi:hypothetical protein
MHVLFQVSDQSGIIEEDKVESHCASHNRHNGTEIHQDPPIADVVLLSFGLVTGFFIFNCGKLTHRAVNGTETFLID